MRLWPEIVGHGSNPITCKGTKWDPRSFMTLFRILVLAGSNIVIAAAVYFFSDQSDPAQREPMSQAAHSGRQIWLDHGCANCHSIFGLGGHAGPDLTNLSSRRDIEYSQRVIEYGIGIMPPGEISPGDIANLLSYLDYINNQGIYPPSSFPDDSFGVEP